MDSASIHETTGKHRVFLSHDNLPAYMCITSLCMLLYHIYIAWARLHEQATHIKTNTHLRELLKDTSRCEGLVAEHDGILLDYSRECVTQETMVSPVTRHVVRVQDCVQKLKQQRSIRRLSFIILWRRCWHTGYVVRSGYNCQCGRKKSK